MIVKNVQRKIFQKGHFNRHVQTNEAFYWSPVKKFRNEKLW